MRRHQAAISPRDWELPLYVVRDVFVDCCLRQGDAEATEPESPLDLFNHLNSRAAVLFHLNPLFGNESCGSSMGLVMYLLLFALVLVVDLLLV
jgi:hypothetical protein